MRFGFVVPFADAASFAESQRWGSAPGGTACSPGRPLFGVDAWVALGGGGDGDRAGSRLGTLLTPVSRWKPWDLASRVGTVDRLSGGRAVLGAGLGALHDGWLAFEADEGRKARAEKVDECLAIYAGLMAGHRSRSRAALLRDARRLHAAGPTGPAAAPTGVDRGRPDGRSAETTEPRAGRALAGAVAGVGRPGRSQRRQQWCDRAGADGGFILTPYRVGQDQDGDDATASTMHVVTSSPSWLLAMYGVSMKPNSSPPS